MQEMCTASLSSMCWEDSKRRYCSGVGEGMSSVAVCMNMHIVELLLWTEVFSRVHVLG